MAFGQNWYASRDSDHLQLFWRCALMGNLRQKGEASWCSLWIECYRWNENLKSPNFQTLTCSCILHLLGWNYRFLCKKIAKKGKKWDWNGKLSDIFLKLSRSNNARLISNVDIQNFGGLCVNFKQLSSPFCYHTKQTNEQIKLH